MWEHPLPRSVYSRRQEQAQNYGLFVDGELAVIASLASPPADWDELIVAENAPWLSTLATARAFHGLQWSRRPLEEICGVLKGSDHSALFLDCSPPFLAAHYDSLGFVLVETRRRRINRPPCQTSESTLFTNALRRRRGKYYTNFTTLLSRAKWAKKCETWPDTAAILSY